MSLEIWLLGYIICGAIYGLVIWFASFDAGFDDFVREEYQQDPPTSLEKWYTVFASLVIWPYFLWKMIR